MDANVEQGLNDITFSFSINLDNSGVQGLINHGEAYFAIHLECSKTAYRKLLISSQRSIVFHISTTRLNGDVALVGMIIAKKDIAVYVCKGSRVTVYIEDLDKEKLFIIPKDKERGEMMLVETYLLGKSVGDRFTLARHEYIVRRIE